MGSRGSKYDSGNDRRRRREDTAEETMDTSAVTNTNALTEERMNNAFTAKSAKEASDTLLAETSRAWTTLSDEEKIAIRSYTGKLANELNTYLWEGKEVHGGYDNITDTYYEGDVHQPLDILTGALNKSELQQDTWLERGIGMDNLKEMLGIGDVFEISDLIDSGKTFTHKGFMSTSAGDIQESLAKSFGNNVLLKIFAPKGTKGMYINPVSKFGDGLLDIGYDTVAKYPMGTKKVPKINKDWDGKTSHAYGSEHEVLLQRGLNFRIHSQEVKGSRLELTIEIVD